MGESSVEIEFFHGLGDCANLALVAQLYKRHGIEISVRSDENKDFIWHAAGIRARAESPLNHPWTHPNHFWDINAADHDANKVGGNVGVLPLPELGISRETLWQELTAVEIDVTASISMTADADAKRFLEGLPAPIIALHAVGTNGQADKSIDAETQVRLQQALLELDGSIVILDYDARAVQIGHERIRGIKPTWGHLSLEELAALLSRCDLLIAVDSGPLHYARLTRIPVLGVFYNRGALLPHRVAVPSPRLTSLVPAALSEIWSDRQAAGLGWRFLQYPGPSPAAKEIAEAAALILRGDASDSRTVLGTAGRYIYRREGFDERPMELLMNGTVGEGAGDNEQRWRIVGDSLLLIGERGVIALLKQDDRQIWRGQWLEFEKMPVELVPTWKPLSRGNGFRWHVDPSVERCDFDLSNHEDWIYNHLKVNHNGLFVDVGAFVGAHAIRVAKSHQCRALAIEPITAHADILEINSELNGVTNQVKLIRTCVGAKSGMVKMSVRGMSTAINPSGETMVPMQTLAQIFRLENAVPELIKIDVEGFELDVLSGLGDCRPDRIIVEVHTYLENHQDDESKIKEWAELHGYAVSCIGRHPENRFCYLSMTHQSPAREAVDRADI